MSDNLTKNERKELKKEEVRAALIKQQHAIRLRKMLKWGAVLIAGAAVVIGISFVVKQSAANTPGQEMPDQGREHIKPGDTHEEYNSTPPASGPHANAASWGQHNNPIPYEDQIHNLEHGGVIIHYQPDRIQNLSELQSLFDELNKRYPKMVLVPDPQLSTTYVLTAWRWIYTFDSYDADQIRLFIKKRYNKAPEPNAL